MQALELTICYYLNCESHIHLGVLRQANAKAKSEQNLDASHSCDLLQMCECECEKSAVRWMSLLEVL